MGNSQNFIEINGKKYDALTGVMYNPTTTTHAHKPVVDGFVRRQKDTTLVRSSLHSTSKNTVAPQKSKTLMRSAVKKPSSILAKTKHSDVSVHKPIHHKPSITLHPQSIPEHRQKLAESVQKSNFIHKFSATAAVPTVKLAPLGVKPAPGLDITTKSTMSVLPTKKSDLLDRALESAQGHKEPFYVHRKSLRHRVAKKIGVSGRTIAITTTVFAGLIVGGFYAYQNVPRLALKVAASRAGFDAAMPSYSPAGFSFSGPVQYSSGQVVVDFKSNTDDRQYKLTQQTSSWSSDSLLNNFVLNDGKQYQTYQDRGRTIYIYDGDNATWVNGGVWYQIQGKSELTSDQLVRIAASL